MRYRNVEIMLKSIELRPLMDIPEKRISFLYFFLSGYIGCALSADVAEEIDEA